MANRRRYQATVIAASVIAMGSLARAQTVSVDGAVMAGRDARDSRLPAGVVGASAGVAVRVGTHWTLGIESDWPGTRHYDTHSDSTTVLGVRFVDDRRDTFQGPIVAVTSGWRFRPRPRLTVMPLIGLGTERRHFTASGTLDSFDAHGVPLKHDAFATADTFTWLSMPIGIDVAFALNTRIAIASQGRLYVDPLSFLNDGCCDGQHTEARLGLRWSF